MESLSPAQIEQIKKKKLETFRRIGLPEQAGLIADSIVENMPIHKEYVQPVENNTQQNIEVQQPAPIRETFVEVEDSSNIAQQIQNQLQEERAYRASAMNTAPRDKFSALEAIRRGSKKQEFSNFIKADSPNQKFQELRVSNKPKAKNNQERSSKAVAPQGFSTPKSSEADSLESLFVDGAGISVKSTSKSMQGDLIDAGNDYSQVGPSFDPVSHLRTMAEKKGGVVKNIQLTEQNQSIYQPNENAQMSKMLLIMENFIENQKNNISYDKETLKEII